eukprot:gene8072-9930_t
MGDIIQSVFGIVDKRLNRLKGLSLKIHTKEDIQNTIPQYLKIIEILGNAKLLLSNDPGNKDQVEQNIKQIDIRINITKQEEDILLKRLRDHDYIDSISPSTSSSTISTPSSTSTTNSAATSPRKQTLSSSPSPVSSTSTTPNLTSQNSNNSTPPLLSPNTSTSNTTTTSTPPLTPTSSNNKPLDSGNGDLSNNDSNNTKPIPINTTTTTSTAVKQQHHNHHQENDEDNVTKKIRSPSIPEELDITISVQQRKEQFTKMLQQQHYPYSYNIKPPSSYNPDDISFSYKEELKILKLNSVNSVDINNDSINNINNTPSKSNRNSRSFSRSSSKQNLPTVVAAATTATNDNTDSSSKKQPTPTTTPRDNYNNTTTNTDNKIDGHNNNNYKQTEVIELKSSVVKENKQFPTIPEEDEILSANNNNNKNNLTISFDNRSKLSNEEDFDDVGSSISSKNNKKNNEEDEDVFENNRNNNNNNNNFTTGSLVDSYILRQMGRSSSNLSISQFIQPYIPWNDSSSVLSQSLQHTPRSNSILTKSSQQPKISQKIKLAKSVPVRKVSEAKIGHARSNSQSSSASSPSSSLNGSTDQLLPNQQIQQNSPTQQHKNGTTLSNLYNTFNTINTWESEDENHGQGERLALLQSLLKAEVLTNNAERKVLDEINKVTLKTSQELYQLVWEVRSLDNAIAHILNNRLQISDLAGIRIYPAETEENSSNCYGSSAVIELSSQLKYSLERLVILLRTEPSILRDTLNRAGYLREDVKVSHTDITQAIVFSLFGNCFTATDEKLLLLLIRSITELEFNICPEKKLFGVQEPFSYTLLSTYLNYTFGKPYIISVLKDLTASIIQDSKFNFESDPEKKKMFAHLGLEEEEEEPEEEDQTALLIHFSCEFLEKVVEMADSIPFGIRWITKVVVELWREHVRSQRPQDFVPSELTKQNDRMDERNLMINIIFCNFFIPALIRPDHYGVLSGLAISQKARHNLNKIATMVLEFLRNPTKIPHHYNLITNLDSMLDEYFTELILVEEPETYYNRPVFELELGQNLLVSSTDLFRILEIVYQNAPPPQKQYVPSVASNGVNSVNLNNNSANETLMLHHEVVEIIKKVQPASQLQEGMKFLVINVIPKPPEKSESRISQLVGQSVRLAKENLFLALSVLNFLCGYSSTNSIPELLQMQCGRSRSLELNILEAQIEETIRSLSALPDSYRKNDFKPLIDSMFEDYYKRDQKLKLEKQLKVLYLDQLQRHTNQIISQKNINIEFLTHQKFRQFRNERYDRMQNEFASEFMSKFSKNAGYCVCIPSLDPIICETCKLKSDTIKSFLYKSKQEIINSGWWKDATEDDLTVAYNTLERNLLTHIYHFTFNISKEDVNFSKQLNSKFSSIDPSHLDIPLKYANQAPWELAQKELRKINRYNSPHDKMKCIIDTWNIIFNYTRPLGDSGPDDFLPIMGFVIIKSRTENLLSNIQYISLYTCLDATSEVWFMNLKSSIEFVKSVLKDANIKGWIKGFLGPTNERMVNLQKDLKKQRKKKFRTSIPIVRIESRSP